MITIDASEIDRLARDLATIADRKNRFAIARTLTDSAADARDQVKRQTRRVFDLKTDWILKGIRSTTARKNDLESRVYSKDDFLKLQETGGHKTAETGGPLAIPGKSITDRRTSRGKIRRRDWAATLLSGVPKSISSAASEAGKQGGRGNKKRGNARPFVVERGGRRFVVRSDKRPRGSNRGTPVLVYNFEQRARIRPKWKFEETARTRFGRVYSRNYYKYLIEMVREVNSGG